jgi:hypothetical protein
MTVCRLFIHGIEVDKKTTRLHDHMTRLQQISKQTISAVPFKKKYIPLLTELLF